MLYAIDLWSPLMCPVERGNNKSYFDLIQDYVDTNWHKYGRTSLINGRMDDKEPLPMPPLLY